MWQNESGRKMILKQASNTFWVKELADLKYIFKYYGANESRVFEESQRESSYSMMSSSAFPDT